VASSLAGRLAMLDTRLTEADRDTLTRLAGGTHLSEIAHRIVGAIEPNEQIAAAEAAGHSPGDGPPRPWWRNMLVQALEPLISNPELETQ
jgi:hypothetical protein